MTENHNALLQCSKSKDCHPQLHFWFIEFLGCLLFQVILIWSLMTFTPPHPVEQSSARPGAWLSAGAWLPSFSSGSLLSPCISWWERREASGRFVRKESWRGKFRFHPLFWSVRVMLLSVVQRVKVLCSPSEDWHAYLDIHRGECYSEERRRQRIADNE